MEEGPFDIRQRLVGAVILVVLAVVLLPILLKQPASQVTGHDVLTLKRTSRGLMTSWSQAAQAPGGPATGTGTKPLNTEPVAASVAGTITAQAPRESPVLGKKSAPVQKVLTPALKRAAPLVHPSQGQWYVQVGAYVNAVDAYTFKQRLRAQGFPAHTQLTRLPSGRGVVVILGPYRHGYAQSALGAVARRDKVRGVLIHRTAGTT